MRLYKHDSCLTHDTGPGHPEHAGRVEAVLEGLATHAPSLRYVEAPLGTSEQVLLAHPRRHLDLVLDAVPTVGRAAIDGDTVLSPGSGEASLRAVGAVCDAIDHAFAEGTAIPDDRKAFAAVRPPGHHAEANRAMGFCLFNSVAIGAAWAMHREYAERVAILDFDVHHGNGTQDIFWQDGRVQFASSHQFPLYPGTGSAEERGAVRNVLNAPLRPGSGGADFREAWRHILDAIDHAQPDLLVVSAGFDAHRLDPLADLNLDTEDYIWIAEAIRDLAEAHCHDRVISVLEGGYSLTALREAVPEYVAALGA